MPEECPGCECCADFNEMEREFLFNARVYRGLLDEGKDYVFIVNVALHIQQIENERETKGPVQ